MSECSTEQMGWTSPAKEACLSVGPPRAVSYLKGRTKMRRNAGPMTESGLLPNIYQTPLVQKRVPEFNLPPVKGRVIGLSTAKLLGQVSLLNIFASWRESCNSDHSDLLWLKRHYNIPLFGINFKDVPDEAARWLDAVGDPYTNIGADLDGRVTYAFGTYGVPETFIIGMDGLVVHRHHGFLWERVARRTIAPVIERLQNSTL